MLIALLAVLALIWTKAPFLFRNEQAVAETRASRDGRERARGPFTAAPGAGA